MKKIVYLPLFIILALTAKSQFTNAVFKPSGKVSGDIENVNKEADPKFTAVHISAASTRPKPGSNNKKLSQVENGMQIVEKIVDRLIQGEYSFALLSGHKYMINNCLGIKASAGQFDLKFANPEITMVGGKFSVKLKIDKIKFSALKVRSRPRVPDFSDPDPCHFSGKFEVGGEATDVSVRVTMDLIAVASTATAGYCSLAFGEPVEIRWNIGGFNLRPFPNSLDNMGKNMIEDALNNGMTDLVYNRLLAAAKAILPEYFDACETPGKVLEEAGNIPNAVSSGTEPKNPTTKPVTGLAKGMGRLNLLFPKGVEWDVDIYSAANKFLINRSSANKHLSYPLAAGTYNIKLNTVPVNGIMIEQGKETRIPYGILNISMAEPWELRSSNDKFLTSGNKIKRMAIPVGTYLLKTGEQTRTIEIVDQQEQDIAEDPVEPTEQWIVKPGTHAGSTGNLELNLPENTKWDLAIFNEASNEYVQTVSASNDLRELSLAPGKYRMLLNNVPVNGIPSEAGSSTALKVGIVNVKSNTAWTLWDETGKNHFKTENGAARMVFPIGKYIIKMTGGNIKIEVKENEVLEF